MRIFKRLKLFEEDPTGNLLKASLSTPSFARGLLGTCDVVSDDDPSRGRFLGGIALRLTSQLEDLHLIVRSYGAIGAACRSEGRFAEADDAYATGLALAAGCPCRDPGYRLRDGDTCCGPDLLRRRAVLRIDQALVAPAPESRTLAAEALALTVEAMERGRSAEFLGRVLLCRGIVEIHHPDELVSAAVADLETSLDLLPLKGRWKWLSDLRWAYYSSALQNLTLALAKSENPDDVRRGLKLFPKVRTAWKRIKRIGQHRAKLDWTEGLLVLKAISLDVVPAAAAAWTRADVIDILEDAKERLDSPVDIGAIAADLAEAHRPDATRMRAALESLRATPDLTLPPDLACGLEEVLAARSQAAFTTALKDFRESATAMGAPPQIFPY